MGFFDLVNIRSINKKLGDLMPVVEANLSRLSKYFDNNFKVKKKTNNSFYAISEPEEIIERKLKYNNYIYDIYDVLSTVFFVIILIIASKYR